MRSCSNARPVPHIAYASEPTKQIVIAAAEAGATAVLPYPFSVSVVEDVLKKACPDQIR
jgi:hypothetical protein